MCTRVLCIFDWQLVTNWIIEAIFRTRWMKVKKQSIGVKGQLCTSAVQVAEHTLCASSEEETDLTPDGLGHCSWSSFNHSGPFHQRMWVRISEGYIPHETQSAGLFSLITCFQWSGWMSSITWATRSQRTPRNDVSFLVTSWELWLNRSAHKCDQWGFWVYACIEIESVPSQRLDRAPDVVLFPSWSVLHGF